MCPVYSVNYVTGLYLSLTLSQEGEGVGKDVVVARYVPQAKLRACHIYLWQQPTAHRHHHEQSQRQQPKAFAAQRPHLLAKQSKYEAHEPPEVTRQLPKAVMQTPAHWLDTRSRKQVQKLCACSTLSVWRSTRYSITFSKLPSGAISEYE